MVLDAMCNLELVWLDEHRYIFTEENACDGTYEEEEERTLGFYRAIIKGLTVEQISMASENHKECILSLY